MAGSVNKVILIGNLGGDPEIRYFDGGLVVAKFSIATTESYTNKSGERIDHTEWHQIEVWENMAKVAEKYLKKGNQVYIEGKIRTANWTDREGQQKSGVTIRANSMTLLGGTAGNASGENNNGNQGYAPSTAPRTNQAPRAANPVPPAMAAVNDDELPF